MPNKIYELLEENTLSSNKEIVSILIDRAENKQKNEEFYSVFQQYLIDSKVNLVKTYLLVGPKRGLACLVSEFLSFYVTVADLEEQVRLLKSLLQDLGDLHTSKRPILKMTVARNLLQILGQFGASRSLARNEHGVPIRFYFIPYGNRHMNAGFFPHLHLVVIYKNDLDSEANPEYIFMHELGHVVQLHMTRSLAAVPDSFKKITRGMFKPCSDEVLVEVFADCFSVAVMMGTPFEGKNYFCTAFLQEHQTLLRDYFTSLFRRSKDNRGGL